MAANLREIHDAFELLFRALVNKSFTKSKEAESWGEQELLFSVRTFLLGYFKEESVFPEAKAILPGKLSGRLDFIIDGVAVEFAVRRPNKQKRCLKNVENESEVKKLLKFNGKSILVLFDFSSDPLTDTDLDEYRNHPSLGKGNHGKSPYQISYFYKKIGKADSIRKQIRL